MYINHFVMMLLISISVYFYFRFSSKSLGLLYLASLKHFYVFYPCQWCVLLLGNRGLRVNKTHCTKISLNLTTKSKSLIHFIFQHITWILFLDFSVSSSTWTNPCVLICDSLRCVSFLCSVFYIKYWECFLFQKNKIRYFIRI